MVLVGWNAMLVDWQVVLVDFTAVLVDGRVVHPPSGVVGLTSNPTHQHR